MRETLAEHHRAGEYVLQSARMVGDENDHAVWRRSRCAWRDALLATFNRLAPGEPRLDALNVRLDGPPSGWKKLYEAELRALQSGLDLLAELEEELSAPPELVVV
jgi:hypothetical protein